MAELHATPEAQARIAALLAERPRVRWLFVVLSVILILVGLIVGALGLAVWRLSQGPIVLPALTERVLATARSHLPPGLTLTASEVALLRTERGLTVRLAKPLLSQSGQEVFTANGIDIVLDALTLLSGAPRATDIEVNGVDLVVEHDSEGRFSLAGFGRSTSAAHNGGLAAIMALTDQPDAPDRLRVSDVTVRYRDDATGSALVWPPVDAVLTRAATGAAVTLRLTTTAGSSATGTVTRRGDGGAFIELSAAGFPLAELAPARASDDTGRSFEGRVNLLARGDLTADGAVASGTMSLEVLNGAWRPGAEIRPFEFDEAGLGLRWSATDGFVRVETATLRAGDAGLALEGRIDPPGASPLWHFELAAPGATIAGSTAGEPPLRLDRVGFSGSFDPDGSILAIEQGILEGPTTSVFVQGAVTIGDTSPGFNLVMTGATMPVGAFKRLWPFFAAPPARDWFSRNVRGGTVESAMVALAIPPGAIAGEVPFPPEAVEGEIAFAGTSVNVLASFPPIAKATGLTRFDARSLTVRLDSGVLEQPEGVLTIADGLYAIPDTLQKNPRTQTNVRLTGGAAAFAALMKREPVASAVRGFRFDPRQVAGGADLTVSLGMPLVAIGPAPSIDYAVKGRVTDVTIDGFEGNRLENATVDLDVRPKAIAITGKGTFAGAPATVRYNRSGTGTPEIELSLTLDDKARARRGIALGEALTGPVGVEVRAGPTRGNFAVDVDFSRATVNNLVPGWRKAAGRPGKASFVWRPEAGSTLIDDLVVRSGTVSVAGSVRLTSAGEFQRARLSQFRLSERDNVTAVIERDGGTMSLSVSGGRLDLRPMIRALRSGDGGPGKAGSRLTLDIREAVGFGGESIADLKATVTTKTGGIAAATIAGVIRGRRFSIRNAGAWSFDVSDVGSLFRFADFYGRIRGGRLEGSVAGDFTSGLVNVLDFQVFDEPALSRFYAEARAAPQFGDGGNAAPAPKRSVQFSRLRLRFQRAGERIELSEVAVTGPDIGATMSGFIDYGRNRVEVTGTFVPAYMLNNIFARIPVLGLLLGGGNEYEGLFGVTFRVTGSPQETRLSVNPLSALAPGVLRRMFDFQKQP